MQKNLLPIALMMSMACPTYAQNARPPISLKTYLTAFAQVPDSAKTVYAVSLLVAIPNVRHPRALFSWPQGKLGHVFLGLTKSYGTQAVTQFIGFYSVSPLIAIGSGRPVRSKIIDNGGHRYNASISMNLTAKQFDTVMNSLLRNASKPYAIYRYNCVHYALDAFNSVRSRPLSPGQKRIPGLGTVGFLTPNALYRLLCRMQTGPEAKNVYVLNKEACAGASFGPSRPKAEHAAVGLALPWRMPYIY